jgi:hypothetical protein
LKKKLERLKRIERLQKRIHELSTWKLSKLAARKEQLDVAHIEMIAALGEGLLSFGGAASAATRRIRALEVEKQEANVAHEAGQRQSFELGMRARAAERAVQATAAEARAEADKKSLEALIEQSLRADGPVPRKF